MARLGRAEAAKDAALLLAGNGRVWPYIHYRCGHRPESMKLIFSQDKYHPADNPHEQ